MFDRSFIVVSALALGACAGPIGGNQPPPAPIPVQSQLQAELGQSSAKAGVSREVVSFYGDRSYQPLWYDDGEYASARASVVAELQRTAPSLGTLDAQTVQSWNAAYNEAAGAELGLTEASLRYAAALRGGRIKGSQETAGAASVMLNIADRVSGKAAGPKSSSALADFVGQDMGIAHYEALAAAGGWRSVPSGPSLEPGGSDSRLDALRARLTATGELVPGASSGPIYDPILVQAVKNFQTRHGLAPDGVIGPATLKALNVPVETRLAQLRASRMEVAKLERRLGTDYVIVNVPAYELRLVRGGDIDHEARVIVGSVANETPEIHSGIDRLVFNPTWGVPYSIARDELIHEVRSDPGVINRKGFDVLDGNGKKVDASTIDWAATGPGTYRFRQRPGAGNALGNVKFLFPNEHSVYLHDTPSRHLFARSKRAMSHGCVRVDDPMALAAKLLEGEGWDRSKIDQTVAGGRLTTVRLDNPMSVHLTYITAWTDSDGSVQFRDDVYGRQRSAPVQIASN